MPLSHSALQSYCAKLALREVQTNCVTIAAEDVDDGMLAEMVASYSIDTSFLDVTVSKSSRVWKQKVA